VDFQLLILYDDFFRKLSAPRLPAANMIRLQATKRFCTFGFIDKGDAQSCSADSEVEDIGSPTKKRARMDRTATENCVEDPSNPWRLKDGNGSSSGSGTGGSKVLNEQQRLDLDLARRAESKWLSDQLVAATLGVQNIALQSPQVLEVLEPHLAKCRDTRSQQLKVAAQKGARSVQEVLEKIGDLQEEAVLEFDTAQFRLKEAFVAMLFGPAPSAATSSTATAPSSSSSSSSSAACGSSGEDEDIDHSRLERLHEWAHADLGQKKARDEKRSLLAPLLDATARAPFQVL